MSLLYCFPDYQVEGILLYNFLTRLSSSNPPSLFISPSFKTDIATVQQQVMSHDISTVRVRFTRYYIDSLLGAISTSTPFYALSDQDNIDLYEFIDIFLQFFDSLLNTFSYYVQEFKRKGIDVLKVLQEVHQASVILGGVKSTLKKLLTQRVSVNKVITLEETSALNQSVHEFKSAITSFDFILSENERQHYYSPCGFDQYLLMMFRAFYSTGGPCFLVDASPMPSAATIKKKVISHRVCYARPLSLVKKIPMIMEKKNRVPCRRTRWCIPRKIFYATFIFRARCTRHSFFSW